MAVKLISYSQPTVVKGSLEDQVAYCARVSNPDNQENTVTNGKLVKYLMKHKHWSPLEMVSVCLEVETTRDIARQILRHRSFSFQEFSQRYADPTKELHFVEREARFQDLNNRQNSIECTDYQLDADWKYKQKVLIDAADDTYRWARSKNIAKEQARCVLPEGCTLSRMYMNGTLRSWIHYVQLRTDKATQLEHRNIAEECRDVIAEVFPLIKEIGQDA